MLINRLAVERLTHPKFGEIESAQKDLQPPPKPWLEKTSVPVEIKLKKGAKQSHFMKEA
jgi:hypothetical protein